jgi:hypothetical protein
MLELPTRDEFVAQLNTKFRVDTDAGQPREIELTEVTELSQKPRQESFAVIFLAPSDFVPVQGLYTIKHDALGTLDIFMVPVSNDKRGVRFEAVFNHLISSEDD